MTDIGAPADPGTGADRPRLALRYSALSDVGRVRKDNQDSGFASEHLLVIADGVGGAARGDLASSTAVQVMRRLDEVPPQDMLQALAGALHRAHDRIAELVEQDRELEGTSTTVTSALFDGQRIGIAHIGDSRGYLLRDGTLSQLTRDHTFVQSLVDEGQITEDQARTHPQRNLILRAVDGVQETDPDLFYIDAAPGDRLLLCSDGVSGVLDADRLADILGTGTVDYAAVELVRSSLAAGSSDNVTCVVADVVEADTPAEIDGIPQGAVSGALVVGAAAESARRGSGGGRNLFRGHRGGDTGEIDPVPAGPAGATGTGAGERPGGAAPADPEELRYAPRAPRRGRWIRRLAVLVTLLVLIGLGAAVAYRWSQDQYYVADHGGTVAIYRGVQADIPGVTLSHHVEDTDVTIAALPDYPTEQVNAGISADSLREARAIVTRLSGLARPCPATSTASPTASPTATPSASPTGSSSATPSGGSTAGASPSQAASPTLAPPECVEATP